MIDRPMRAITTILTVLLVLAAGSANAQYRYAQTRSYGEQGTFVALELINSNARNTDGVRATQK